MNDHVIYYDVQLRGDTAFSQRAGAGVTVQYVPGVVLLGHMARHYQAALDSDLAWQIFHSGETRFGDARLVSPAGMPARVLPLSVRFKKGVDGQVPPEPPTATDDPAAGVDNTPPSTDRRIFLHCFDKHEERGKQAVIDLWDLAPDDDRRDTHKEDKPGMQVWPSGQQAKISQRVDLKTSVSYDSQRAKQGALFHIPTLAQGQHFRGRIECPSAEVKGFIEQRLFGAARLGSSRRSEYGRADIKQIEPFTWPAVASPQPGYRRFLLLSDTCLIDANGLPTTTPTPAHFGLPDDSELVPDKTFVRTCRFTPFNGHHRRPGMERVALLAGSLITFTAPDGMPAPTGAYTWVGAHQAEGLGHVWVDPPLLQDWPGRESPPSKRPELPGVIKRPADRLGLWRDEQAALRHTAHNAELAREKIVEALDRIPLPNPTQWRRLARVARATHRQADLVTNVKQFCQTGVAQYQWRPVLDDLIKAIDGKPPLGVALAAEILAQKAQKKGGTV